MMKKLSLNLMAIVLCILIITIAIPKNTYASSVPSAPANLTAAVTNTNQIYLTWDSVSYSTGYFIYRATSPSGAYSIIASPTTTTYTDTSLSQNTTYYYKVQAANSAGVSSDSSIVYAIITNTNAVLSAPTNLTAAVTNTSQIYLTWDTVSYQAYYYVYRATSPSGTYTMVATPTTTNYTDSSLTQNTTYYYKVQAVNSGGVSSYSSIAYATTTSSTGIPLAPTNLAATSIGTNQIYLTWNPVSSNAYYIYRATSPSGTYTMVATSITTNYTDSNLTQNTTYYYKVQAMNSSGTSSDSAIVYALTTGSNGAPSAPTNLTATTISTNQIYLTWNPVSNANAYYVYRAASPSGTYTMVATSITTNYTDSSLTLNTTYYYKIQAMNSSGISSDSSIVYATTTSSNGAPSVPTNLTATTISTNQIYLTWNPVSNANTYYVYRATSPSGTYTMVAALTTTSDTDSSLTLNTTYYYKVQAVNSTGTSSDSAIVYATTTSVAGVPSVPTNLTATTVSTNQIFLTWNSVSNATSYYVYRATSPSGTYTMAATPTTTTYTDSSLTLNTTYYYKVQAVNSYGTSSDSAIVYATTTSVAGVPSVPTNLTATTVSTNQIYLTWNSVGNATSYYVYRATSPSGTYTMAATPTTTTYTDSSLTLNTTYYYKVQAMNSSGLSSFSSIANATTNGSNNTVPSDTSTQIPSERLAGTDMYETSAEVAKSGWQTSYFAIIVSGENFSDALCSAPLALKYNAPLLLTSKDTLNDQTKTQLSRLKVKEVKIIGGVGVISTAVEQSIKNMGISVTRIAGNDRYDTSLKIAQSMGQFTQAVIASGDTFPDALSIAPIAAMKGIPILLTPKDSLPDGIKSYLAKTVQSTYVVGGTGVISDNVLKQLPSPKRLSGIDRYETNISIISEFANDLDFSKCYVSTGEQFADALAGSALAALSNSPVFLVSNPVNQSTIDYFRSKLSSINKEIVFGGTVVVPDSILTSLNGTTSGSNALSAPTNIIATSESSSQINLTWDSVSGATSYSVYGASSSSGTYTRIATVTTTSLVDTGLSAATTYYYKVQAVNSDGSSSYSPIAYAKTNES